MGTFTNWGVVELKPDGKNTPIVNANIDSDSWGWYATAQIMIEVDGEIMLNDNFQSGLKGPIGDPEKTKSYPLALR